MRSPSSLASAAATSACAAASSGVAGDDEIGRGLGRLRHVLRHLRHVPLRRDREVAACPRAGCRSAARTGWTCRRRCAHQADFFTGVDRHRRIVEQDLGATPKAEILEDDHAEDAARRKRARPNRKSDSTLVGLLGLGWGKAFTAKDAKEREGKNVCPRTNVNQTWASCLRPFARKETFLIFLGVPSRPWRLNCSFRGVDCLPLRHAMTVFRQTRATTLCQPRARRTTQAICFYWFLYQTPPLSSAGGTGVASIQASNSQQGSRS
jgi:hypothetical protein